MIANMPWVELLIFLMGFGLGVAGALVLAWYLLGRRTDPALAEKDRQILALRREQGEWLHRNKRLERKVSHLPTLEAQNAELRTAVADLQTTGKKDKDELKRVQGNLDRVGVELDSQYVQLEELRAELAASNRRYEDLKGQFDIMIDRFTEVQRLRQNILVASQMLKQEQARSANLQAQFDALGVESTAEPAGPLMPTMPDRVVAEPPVVPTAVVPEQDLFNDADLEAIEGIGPIFARRLNDSGIHTISEVAKASPDRLAEFAGLKPWQKEDSAEWIAEAKRLLAQARWPRA